MYIMCLNSEGPAHTGCLGVVMASGDMWPRVAPFY